MAKSKEDEYPNNKSILARVQCMMSAITACRRSLEDLAFAVEMPPAALRGFVKQRFDDAVAKAELAAEAMSGDESD